MTRLLAWVAAALVFACSDPVEVQHGTLTIDLRRGGNFVWPRGGDTRITVVNGLDDQRGFAGFELDIAGTIFTARNFTTDESSQLVGYLSPGRGTGSSVPSGAKPLSADSESDRR